MQYDNFQFKPQKKKKKSYFFPHKETENFPEINDFYPL